MKLLFVLTVILLFGISHAVSAAVSAGALAASSAAASSAAAEQAANDAVVNGAKGSQIYDVASLYGCSYGSGYCINEANIEFSKVKQRYNCDSIAECIAHGWNVASFSETANDKLGIQVLSLILGLIIVSLILIVFIGVL